MSTLQSIFQYSGYRDYLIARLESHGPRSGFKKRAAEALQVHTTMISQILKGHCEISLEQAEKMNLFLGHKNEESQHFLLLVLRDRAGSSALRKRFDEQIESSKTRQFDLSKRVSKEKEISEVDQQRFYSSYIYSAIHVLSSVSRFNRVSTLSRLLGAPENEIQNAVDFLTRLGVVVEKQGLLSPGSKHVHLGRTSKFLIDHHLNWRLKAMDRIRENPSIDLHYSGAMSISIDDASKIKEILVSSISNCTEAAVKSKEETAYVMCIDFFNLTKS